MFLNSTNVSLSYLINLEVDLTNGSSKTISVNKTPNSIDHTVARDADADDSDRQMVIAAAIVILVAIFLICSLLCYREISRRRFEAYLMEEYVRKEEIKKTIKKKIAQMQNVDDSDSYREDMRLKVPLVTFGDVTKISPAHSFETLHFEAHHHHHHHHHYHHHHHHARVKQAVLTDNKNISLTNSGKEKHWYASAHKIPTRGRFLTFLFGNGKKQKQRTENRRETKDLQVALNPIQNT